MNLGKKIGISALSVLAALTLASCGEETSNTSYYWYSTYQIFENTTDNCSYYTFYVDLFDTGEAEIKASKEDFKVTDKNGSYTPAGFITSYYSSSITIGGVTKSQYAVEMVDTFTFKKESDGIWNNTILAFTDNFDKDSAKVTYKGVTMTVKPGYEF